MTTEEEVNDAGRDVRFARDDRIAKIRERRSEAAAIRDAKRNSRVKESTEDSGDS